MNELDPLSGKVAVVTGGGSGIGLATVRRLIAAGARVHALDRRQETIDARLEAELSAGMVTTHGLDVTDAERVDRLIAQIGDETPIELLVCAAGTNIPDRRLDELTQEGWHRVVETNLDGVFSCVRAALPQLRETRGHAVVIASVSSLWPDGSGAAYQAAKAGVLALVRAASFEEHRNGVRFTAILPGMTETGLISKRPPPLPSAEVRAQMLQPDDVAATILCALSLPPRACLGELTIVPTALQAVGKTQE
jgi:NAD(P)-dependent dehydrogenase (short-subunit alcohol dehydrogenase family)